MNSTPLKAFVSLALLASLAATPAFAQTPPFDRTVIVGGSGAPIANGTALLTALAGITTASATDPWKILVEPGIFDLQGSTLTMKDFVDIQGSGRDVTYVRSFGAQTVSVPATVNAELRDLTVQSFTDASGTAVETRSSEFLLTQVNLEAVSATNATAFVSNGANPRVSEVFARVASEQGSSVGFQVIGGAPVISETFVLIEFAGTTGTGFDIQDGSLATLLEVRAQLFEVPRNAIALSIANASRPQVQNCNLLVRASAGSSGDNRGISVNRESVASVKDCVASVTGGNRSTGLWIQNGSTVDANESSFSGFANQGYGLFNARGTVQVDRSTLDGNTRSVINNSSLDVTVIGASRLVGTAQTFLGSTLSCAQSYNGLNAPVNAACL